ncbi:MAG: OmpA family protein [Gammaproteobacteria bacterium]|jgi:OOP family OmpA-OmpF porin|nr:OmpA family protein [Gammaproteobacteria bacterium]
MKTIRVRILTAVTAAVIVSSFSMTAAAQYGEYDDRWYVSAFGGLAALDSDRADVDDAGIFGVGFGKFLSDDFSLEVEFDRIDSDLTPPPGFTNSNFNAKAAGLFMRYHLLSADNQVRPYFGFGIGATYRQSFDTNSTSFDKDTAIYISPIAGLAFELTDNFGARIQAAWRNDMKGDSAIPQGGRYNDFLFTAGITYKLGDPPAPPPPPAKPAPPPPPPAPVDGDDDRDGVKNSRDKCPNTRAGAVVDADGCEVQVIIDLPNVNFAFDRAVLTSASFSILDDAVATLQRHKQVRIEVAGHTDSVGTDNYNLSLSDRRAAVVRDYLISKGISADRMTSAGYGETRPIASNDNDAGRAQNRRTELVITSK